MYVETKHREQRNDDASAIRDDANSTKENEHEMRKHSDPGCTNTGGRFKEPTTAPEVRDSPHHWRKEHAETRQKTAETEVKYTRIVVALSGRQKSEHTLEHELVY